MLHAAPDPRKRLGPFVGLGDPNDYLPTPGVTRVYQDDANWQDAVLDLVRRAGAVILVEGSTPGFRWEMTQVRRLCRPEKVFVIIPPTEYRVSASGRFVIFMSEAGFEIPVYSIDGVLVGFDEKYQAFVLKKHLLTPDDFSLAISDALASPRGPTTGLTFPQ